MVLSVAPTGRGSRFGRIVVALTEVPFSWCKISDLKGRVVDKPSINDHLVEE